MTDVSKDMIDCWRANYGLDSQTPADAARYWSERFAGMAPAGAVAALGLALAEVEALRKDAGRYRWLRSRLCAKPAKAVSGSIRQALDVRIGRAYFDSTFRPRKDDDEQVETLDSAIDAAMAPR